MVVAVSESAAAAARRPPLLPSERDNGGGRQANVHSSSSSTTTSSRKPKSRLVTSRYLSSSPSTTTSTSTSTSTTTTSSSTTSSSSSSSSNLSRRSAPSSATHTPDTPTPATAFPSPALKRSQSVDRRRPATPRLDLPLADSKILFTSTRSLAVSFQGESFSLPISKTKPVQHTPQSLSSLRRSATPERRTRITNTNTNTPLRGGGGGDKIENSINSNSKTLDHHRWPGRARQPNSVSASFDSGLEKKNKPKEPSTAVRALNHLMVDEGSKIRRSVEGRNAALVKSIQFPLDRSVSDSDPILSDTDSVSSGGNSLREFGGLAKMVNAARGVSVPARFWQERDSGKLGTMLTPKLGLSKRYSGDSPVPSPSANRGMSSPLRGPIRAMSPSKLMVSSKSTPSRANPSPSRTRNAGNGTEAPGTVGGKLNNMPSVLSFAASSKMGGSRVSDAHQLRLSYNRQLQWRFVNARADAAMLVQRLTAEKTLYDAWLTISKLRDSVTVKRMKLRFQRQILKLTSILKGQMTCLEECSLLDKEHSSSLSGAIKALEASTLRLPIVGGARVNIQNMKVAVGSAVDVMQAMASSICSYLSKVQEVNSLVAELAKVTIQEQDLLDQCNDLLSTLANMQIIDCSLRTHILQLRQVPTTLTTHV